MISLNGYSPSNTVFQKDVWTPVLDSYNDWMSIGNAKPAIRFGQLHCNLLGICPSWGLENI
jgi:hypothetical protein